MIENILSCFLLSLLINSVFFGFAYKFQTDKLTDLSYSLTFIFISSFSIYSNTSIHLTDWILYILILTWAIRLGSYLFLRINKIKKDNRFDSIRNNIKSFAGFWLIQGISVPIILLPFIIFQNSSNKTTTLYFIAAVLIAVFALLIEGVSDYQKYNFKLKHPNQFMNQGLWKKIRHPNYSGEILFWVSHTIGIALSLKSYYLLLSLLGPIWIILLLVKFSGIPPLEKSWQEKYNKDPRFEKYKNSSWRLIPYIY